MKAHLLTIDPEPRGKSVITTLEYYLDLARRGELSSVCVAAINCDGTPTWDWSELPNTSAAVGAIERLKQAVIRATDE